MLGSSAVLSLGELQRLEGVMAVAFQRALGAVSAMLGCNLIALEFRLEELPLADVSRMLGSPEAPAVGVYAYFYGQGACQALLLLPPDTVSSLMELLVGDPAPNIMALNELQTSALSELGNVLAGSFVGHLADLLNLSVPCTPPAVLADMSGAILYETALHREPWTDTVLLTKSLFGGGGREMAGVFVMFPGAELIGQLKERCL